MPFGFPDIFEVEPPKPKPSPWLRAPVLFEVDETAPVSDKLKNVFAIEWAKHPADPFTAACQVFGTDTTSALWASRNWILDPEVNAIKDAYVKASRDNEKLLDREATARRFLSICDETHNGKPTIEAKDRLKALELYAKMMGYMDDSIIKQTFNNNNTVNNNRMEILFVEPDASAVERMKAIAAIVPTEDSKILEDPELELGIKLVG